MSETALWFGGCDCCGGSRIDWLAGVSVQVPISGGFWVSPPSAAALEASAQQILDYALARCLSEPMPVAPNDGKLIVRPAIFESDGTFTFGAETISGLDNSWSYLSKTIGASWALTLSEGGSGWRLLASSLIYAAKASFTWQQQTMICRTRRVGVGWPVLNPAGSVECLATSALTSLEVVPPSSVVAAFNPNWHPDDGGSGLGGGNHLLQIYRSDEAFPACCNFAP